MMPHFIRRPADFEASKLSFWKFKQKVGSIGAHGTGAQRDQNQPTGTRVSQLASPYCVLGSILRGLACVRFVIPGRPFLFRTTRPL